jgi:hypothetical protein
MSAEATPTTPAVAPETPPAAPPVAPQEAAAAPAAPAPLPPEVAPWNGELPGLDNVLSVAPENVRDALRKGIASVRSNMDRALSERMQKIAEERREAVQQRQLADTEYRAAKDAARKWAMAVDNGDVQSVLEALQADAEGQIADFRSRAEIAEAQAEALEARQRSIVASVTEALRSEYDAKYAPILAERDAERAELEAARKRQREAEAAQEALWAQQIAEEQAALAKRIVAAADAKGASVPAHMQKFDGLAPLFNAIVQTLQAESGITVTDDTPDEVTKPLIEKAEQRVAAAIAALHPKPATAASPNTVSAPPVGEAAATQGRSGTSVPTTPQTPKKQIRLY